MDILEILNEMEEVVEESTRIPLLGKVLIDDDLIMEYIDRIRSSLPEELRNAKQISMEKEKILLTAQQEAKKLMDNAQLGISKMAGESEIAKQAQMQAEEIYLKAKNTAQEIRVGANSFADDVLAKMENSLQKALTVIKNGREELKPTTSKEQVAATKQEK